MKYPGWGLVQNLSGYLKFYCIGIRVKLINFCAGLKRIECIALNGQSRRVVYTPAAYPFGIAIHETYIYWTDWEM